MQGSRNAWDGAGQPTGTRGANDPDVGTASGSRSARLISGWQVAFAGLALVAGALLLSLGRDATFWGDDWLFIDARLSWDLDAFLSPHWEHPMVGVALLWKPLLATIGLQSYLPYLGVLVLLHVITAAAVLRMVQRQAGSAVALAASVVFLFLGSAGEVLLYAIPANLVGSTAAGAWALALFLERPARRGRWLIAALLVVSIATSGPALFFIAAIGAVCLIAPGRRRQLWLVVPALVAYGAWLLTYGRNTFGGDRSWVQSASLLPDYVRDGIAHAVGSLSGLGDDIGLILAVLLLAATIWHLFGRRPILEGAVAGMAGLLAQFGVTGLARAQVDAAAEVSQAEASRYVYMAAVFLLLAGSAWLSRRSPIVLREARVVLPLVAMTGFALAANLVALGSWHGFVQDRAYEVRAAIGILARYGGSPAIPGDRPAQVPADSFLWTLPSPDRLREITTAYGSPADDVLVPGIPEVPEEVVERVLMDYVARALQVEPVDAMPADTNAPRVVATTDVSVLAQDACLRVLATGAAATIVVALAGGSSLIVRPAERGSIGLALSTSGDFTERSARQVEVTGGVPVSITAPDVGQPLDWLIRLTPPLTGATELCSLEPAA